MTSAIHDFEPSDAGPSRHFDPLPPALPPKSPSSSFHGGLDQSDPDSLAPIGNGHGNGNGRGFGGGSVGWPNGAAEIPRPSSGADTHDSGSRRNPLVDLIDSEKTYVEQLGLVIRVSVSRRHRKMGHAH